MAELDESIKDPVLLSNIINKNVVFDNLNTDALLADLLKPVEDISEDSDIEDKAPDVIESIYKSMSKIIESINTDNLIINKQVSKIKSDLLIVCNTVSNIKLNIQEMNDEFDKIKKKTNAIPDLQRQAIETRNILLQSIDVNIKAIKKELLDLKTMQNTDAYITSPELLRAQIKAIIDEEIKIYINKIK
jgi:hypothetical protein